MKWAVLPMKWAVPKLKRPSAPLMIGLLNWNLRSKFNLAKPILHKKSTFLQDNKSPLRCCFSPVRCLWLGGANFIGCYDMATIHSSPRSGLYISHFENSYVIIKNTKHKKIKLIQELIPLFKSISTKLSLHESFR